MDIVFEGREIMATSQTGYLFCAETRDTKHLINFESLMEVVIPAVPQTLPSENAQLDSLRQTIRGESGDFHTRPWFIYFNPYPGCQVTILGKTYFPYSPLSQKEEINQMEAEPT